MTLISLIIYDVHQILSVDSAAWNPTSEVVMDFDTVKSGASIYPYYVSAPADGASAAIGVQNKQTHDYLQVQKMLQPAGVVNGAYASESPPRTTIESLPKEVLEEVIAFVFGGKQIQVCDRQD